MPTNSISLSDRALDHLKRFCQERAKGKSGKLHWDAFLIHAHKEPLPPLPVKLYAWLQDNLTNSTDQESLVEDYQRFGDLLVQWQRSEALNEPPASSISDPTFVCHGVVDEIRAGSNADIDTSARHASLALQQRDLGVSASSPQGSELSSSLAGRGSQPNPHLLIVGRRDTGKTCLMTQLVTRDIEAGDRAIVVVDSDGLLCDQVKRWITEHDAAAQLSQRLIHLDSVSRTRSGFTFNPLLAPEEADLLAVASNVVMAFKAICSDFSGAQTQWNQQTANILRNAVMLLMANGKTLADLAVLLTENDFRDQLLLNVEQRQSENPEFTVLLENWQQYKRLARTDQWISWVEPILSRLQPVLGNPRLRTILTTSGIQLDLTEIIRQRKILLVNVEHSRQGSLLGGLIVNALRYSADTLSDENDRSNRVGLYLDGMKNVIESETIHAISERSKRSRLSLTASECSLSALFPANICSRVVDDFGNVAALALECDDAQILGPKFFPPVELAPLGSARMTAARLNVEMLMRQENGTFYLLEPGKGYTLSQFKTRHCSSAM